jgi:hypothetical protein
MDRKMQLLGFWEFLKIFVRDLYANLAIVEFCKFQAFSVSVTLVFSVLMTGSTPATSQEGEICAKIKGCPSGSPKAQTGVGQ